jgi:RHS repeat-associated protein
VTISDKKLAVDSDGNGVVDYYNADVITANDYYPFGSQMPGRKYSQPNSSYRYGFNGKENDKDISEGGQDYGMRIYDRRVARFLTVDPLAINYPWNSPYSYAEGDPINYEDLDGLERPPTRSVARRRVSNPQLSNSVYRDGKLVMAPVSPTNPGIIPPNAGASRGRGGWNVETPNGGYFVADENPFGPQPTYPKPDFRTQGEKDADAALLAFSYFKQNIHAERQTPTNSLAIITTNPANLPDWYVQDVKNRLVSGKGTVNDWIYKGELVKRGMLSSRFGQAQEFGKGASGDILGRNLERVGQVRLSVNHAAHHIVAGGDKRANGARQILANAGIDINDADNGVFHEAGSHNRMHTNKYYKIIESRLRGAAAGGSANVRKELNHIRRDIKDGKL